MQVAGFQLSTVIHAAGDTVVAHAFAADGRPVVLKLLDTDTPAPEQLARWRHEFALLRELDSPHIIRAEALVPAGRSLVLVLEDFGRCNLAQAIERHRFTLAERLQLALQLVDALSAVHAAGLVHGDVAPKNVLVDLSQLRLKLCDFGLASRLEPELRRSPDGFAHGTLAYVAPEQTGRTSLAVDQRADFYSLGATLYELFAGRPPFVLDDPLALLHAQLALAPQPLGELDPSLPSPLAALVAKLLAKDPDARYQSSHGLRHDLLHLLTALREHGRVGDFALAREDRPERFRVSQRLVGRERLLAHLLQAAERSAQGESALLLLSGPSGIGKTALVNALQAPLVGQRGYFLRGKCDQYRRQRPYAALSDAFRELLRQLAVEGRRDFWQERLSHALGEHAAAVAELLPELSLLCGEPPPLPALPASDAEARLHLAFARFVRVLATPEHPLLLFLDDLQWADAPSLRLLEQLMGADEDQALLVIGAFRDNEVSDDHALRALQMALAPTQRVDELFLGPLDAAAVTTLVAETLRLAPAEVQPLAALCLNKTGGNPFFLVQFLRQLHEDGELRYERAQGRWHWDLEAIAARGITDNVVELMLGSLQRLPASTQRRLAQAAQLGEAFGHAELMHSAGLGAQDLALQLWPALQAGLLQALNEDYRFAETPERLALARYRFLHDRVQQAAHELTPAAERPALLLQLARRLGDISDPVQREARLFTRLDCLNAAEALLQSPAERAELLQLNLQGAAKARASSAHALAAQLLRQALALEPGVELPAEQRLALYRDLAESSYLAGEFEAAERLYPQARAACPAPLDQAQLLVVQADQFHIQGRFGEAFEVLREALALLGAPFPADEAEAQTLFPGEFAAALQALQALEPLSTAHDRDPGAALLQTPPMQAPAALLQMRLMYALTYSTYQSGRLAGFLLDACRLMRLTLDEGQSDLSPVACLAFMTALSAAQRPYAECHALGRIASRLAEARGNAYVRATGYQYFNAFYQHWREPLSATLAPMDRGLQLGLEGVNPLSAGYCALLRCVNRFVLGTPLAELQTEAERSWKYLQSSHQPATAAMLRHGVLQPLAALRGASLAPNRFDSADCEGSDALLAQDGPPGIPWALASAAMLRHALLFDDEAAWRRCSGRLPAIGMVLPDSPSWVDARFFIALGQLRWDGDSADAQALRAPFEAWALDAPGNYRAHQLLLGAELARVSGQERDAMDLYARAIEAAAEQGWALLEALGNELYAAFWMQTQQPQLAKQFLREAYHHYRAWGASAKCRQLEARWPQQIVHAALRGLGESSSLASASATHSGLDATPLDLRSLVKAQQALASEVHLDGLLRQMFAVLLENAGAQRGAIVLLDEGRWRVETLGAWQGEALEAQRLSRPLADCADLLPLPLLEYVQLTRQTLVLNQPGADARFAHSPYLQRHPVRSALCLPLLHQGQLLALVYLEHAQLDHAFPAARRQMLELLGTQAAISLLNARLVEDLEAKVAQRTEALRRLSMRDGLTGVANRRAFDESLVIEWRRSQRSGQPLSLLMIDIDHFKQYNDHYGHIEGDRCIQLVAQLLQRSAERAGDCVARYGGEEFAMLLPATGLDAALALARDCQAALAAQALPHARSDTAPVLTLSMGLACLQADEGGPERLLRAADEALYRAKRGGRSRVVCAG